MFVMCVETAGMNGKHRKYMCITKQATKRGILGIVLNAGKYVLRENTETKRAKKKTAYRGPKKISGYMF